MIPLFTRLDLEAMLGASRVDMCPSASDSGPVYISVRSSDEEVILFLEGRKAGDPVPENVITGVNPSSVEPRDSPENYWYLYNSVGPGSEGECQIYKTKSGYWTTTDDTIIFTSRGAVGRKRTLKFYEGFGQRTGWMMLEYQVELPTTNECNYSKDNHSLCRIFLQTNGMTLQGGPTNFAGSDDSIGEYVNHVLLGILEHEEENLSLENSDNSSHVETVAEKNEGQSAISRIADEAVHEYSADSMFETYHFSNGEYMEELNGLCSPETPASSDFSTIMSADSDEYFDPDELLRIIESDRDIEVQGQTNLRFDVHAPVRSNQVIIRPPSPGSGNGNSDLAIRENSPASWLVSDEPTSPPEHPLSSNDSGKNDRASTSIRPNQASDTLRNRRSLRGNGSNSIRKMAKMGKKYCCFGSFRSNSPSDEG